MALEARIYLPKKEYLACLKVATNITQTISGTWSVSQMVAIFSFWWSRRLLQEQYDHGAGF